VTYVSTHPLAIKQGLPRVVGFTPTPGTATYQGGVRPVLSCVGSDWNFYSRDATNPISDFEFDPLE
jgi:hypothetical protein